METDPAASGSNVPQSEQNRPVVSIDPRFTEVETGYSLKQQSRLRVF